MLKKVTDDGTRLCVYDQAAKAQQEKLAALKAWTHMDGTRSSSFGAIADPLLYDMLWADYDPDDHSGPVSSTVSDFGDIIESAESDKESINADGPRKRFRIQSKDDGLDDLRFLSDDDFDNALENALHKASESQLHQPHNVTDGGMENEGQETPQSVGQKLKSMSRAESVSTTSKGSKRDKGKTRAQPRGSVKSNDPTKQHNLRAMAEAGQAGRITFLFEKVSKGEL